MPTDNEAGRAATWRKASFSATADTSPMELAVLGEHMRRCALERGTLFPLKRAAEALGRLAKPRFVTTIVVLVSLSILASLVFF